MPVLSIQQEKRVSPLSGNKELDRPFSGQFDLSTPAQDFGHDGTEAFSNRLENDSGVVHRRRIPTPLVLSASPNSRRSVQLTSPDHTLFSSPMVDAMNQCKLPSRHSSSMRHSNPPRHVKMGICYSCPRTPLRSEGSGAGFNPSVNRWQDSETEYDSSNQSLTSADQSLTGTESNQSLSGAESIDNTQELRPTWVLPNITPFHLDHICCSPTSTVKTTASVESSTNDSNSNYSHDSDQSQSPPQSPISDTLPSAIVSFQKPTTTNNIPSALNLNFFSGPCTPPSATKEVNNSFSSSPGVQLTNTTRSREKGSIDLIKNKPRAQSTATPSPMKECTKTIQVRRSFSQLLLFRRPSNIEVSLTGQASSFSDGTVTTPDDDEKEELQAYVSNEHTPMSAKSFRSSSFRSGSILGLSRFSGWRQDCQEGDPLTGVPSNNADICSESSNHPNRYFRYEASSKGMNRHRGKDQAIPLRASVSGTPEGLLRLAKSHSSFRDKIFRSRSQSCQSFQHDEIKRNLAQSPEFQGKSPEDKLRGTNTEDINGDCDHFAFNNHQNSPGHDRESHRSVELEIQEKLKTIKRNDFQRSSEERLGPKNVVSNPSGPMKILKFWKRKKVQNPTDSDNVTKEGMNKIKNHQDNQKIKKEALKQNDKKSIVLSLRSKNNKNSTPIFKSTPSFLNLSVMENQQKKSEFELSRAQNTSTSSLGWDRHSRNFVTSPVGYEGYQIPSFGEGIQRETIENITRNLPKPTRPPRKIPVTMRTT